jgi:hypothetical protein
MTLRELDSSLFVVDHPLVVGGLHLGTRTTVMRVGPRDLLVHAPGPLDKADMKEIDRLGTVTAVVAPNNLHHMFLPAAKDAWKKARVYAPASLTEVKPHLPVDAVEIHGVPKMGETVFVHRESKTLVVTDLAFNIRASKSWFTRTFMKLNGGYDRFGPTRLFRSMVKDEDALKASLASVLELDFDRVIVAHGDVAQSGGKALLRQAFEAWMGPIEKPVALPVSNRREPTSHSGLPAR